MTMRPGLDPADPMLRPLTMREVMEVTGRSRRTIERWVAEKRLTAYEERNRRNVVVAKLYSEAEVVDVEAERAAAARENLERIRRRNAAQSVPRHSEGVRLDSNCPDVAS